jgi:hypothetical protein
MSVLDRWKEFRRAQRDALRASNHPHDGGESSGDFGELLADILPGRRSSVATEGTDEGSAQAETHGYRHETVTLAEGPADEPAEDGAPGARDTDGRPYGRAGRPLNRQSPFYMGFVGAIGVLTAVLLWHTLGRLTTVLTLVVIAFFLALTLNPLVEFLTRRGLGRGGAVALVFAGVVAVFTLLGLVVVPPVISQGTDLAQKAPDYLDSVLRSRFVKDLDQHYGVVDKIQAEFNKRITDGNFLSQVFGGVVAVFTLLGVVVVPPVISQGTDLAQ